MEFLGKIGNYLKKGNVDELVKRNSTLFLIFGLLYLFSYMFLHDAKSMTIGSVYLSTFMLFAFYFRWLKTNGGRTNFYIANALATIFMLGFSLLLVIAFFNINLDFEMNFLYSFGKIMLIVSVIALSIYFALVFLLRKKINAKIFKGNVNTYFFYVVLGIDVLQLLLNTFASLTDVMDAGDAILHICNFVIMLYSEYVLIKYVYFYQEHKNGSRFKLCSNCGFKCGNGAATCPECGKEEFVPQTAIKNVFTEIEEYHNNKKKVNMREVFQVDNLPNGSVGTKIKAYARIAMKFLVVIVFFAFIFSFVFAGSIADMNANAYYAGSYDVWGALLNYLFALVIIYLSIILFYVIMYFNFLLVTGFGAIIEDVNAIKNKN